MGKICFVTLKPLEPYFFGDGKVLHFPSKGKKEDVKTEYYVESELLPSQSTLVGMMRYMVLKKNNLLNSDARKKLNTEQKKLVGESGFYISDTEDVTYGMIQKIGSVFLMNSKEECYLPCPYNHVNSNTEYKPFDMTDKSQESTYAQLVPMNYDAKDGLASGKWVGLKENGKLIVKKDLFKDCEQVGIIKDKTITENGFFKRKYHVLEQGFRFAFFVELDEKVFGKEDKKEWTDLVCMGQKQSTFSFKCVELKEEEHAIGKNYKKLLRELSQKQKEGTNLSVYYAASPVIFQKQPKCKFYISENKTFQYKNQKRENNKSSRFKTDLTYICKAGSVFYVNEDNSDFESSFNNISCQNAGFNRIIKLEDGKDEFKYL